MLNIYFYTIVLFIFYNLIFSNKIYSQETIEEYSINSYHSTYHIACYFYDTNYGQDSKNPFLMLPSKNIATLGARINYYWAIDSDILFSNITNLTGNIQDGFFVESNYSYDDIVNKCNFAINQGSLLLPSQPTYKLYDFKASASTFSINEYPIRFSNNKKEINNSPIKQIVIFGDSLSDNGNLKRWTKILPYFPFWNGRFADGLIWNDYLSERTHIPMLNFAYGGAKTEGTNDAFVNGLPSKYITAVRNMVTGSSKYYIDSYLSNYLTTNSYQSKNQTISDAMETLYIIWIGANDYLEKFENNQDASQFFANPDAIGGSNYVYKRAINNIVEQIKLLNKNGAYHFLVLNLPDIGKTPAILTSKYNKYKNDFKNKEEFSSKLSALIQSHNSYLNTSLNALQNSAGNNIHITQLNIGAEFEKLMNNKNIINNNDFDYGFSNMDSIYPIPNSNNKYLQNFCYKGGAFDAAFTNIGSETIEFANKNNLCVDSTGKRNKLAIFWNSPHPSSYTHCWISYAIEKHLNDNGLIASDLMDMNSIKNYCLNKLD